MVSFLGPLQLQHHRLLYRQTHPTSYICSLRRQADTPRSHPQFGCVWVLCEQGLLGCRYQSHRRHLHLRFQHFQSDLRCPRFKRLAHPNHCPSLRSCLTLRLRHQDNLNHHHRVLNDYHWVTNRLLWDVIQQIVPDVAHLRQLHRSLWRHWSVRLTVLTSLPILDLRKKCQQVWEDLASDLCARIELVFQ